MPVTSRLLEKAASAPNSGVGSRSIPDASISLVAQYCLNGSCIDWTTASIDDVKCYYEDFLSNIPGASLGANEYFYNSNAGVNVGTRLYRNIGGSYTYPTNPETGNWIWFSTGTFNGGKNIITISGSIITAITPYGNVGGCIPFTPTPTPTATATPTPTPTGSATATPTPTPTMTPTGSATATPTPTPVPTDTPTPTPTPTVIPVSSSISINLCAPVSSSSNTVIYAYAVTGSTPIAVNTSVTTSFHLSGSTGTVFSGSLYILSGSTCTSASFSFLPSQSISNIYITDVSPISYGLYSYVDGVATVSGSCPSCP